MGLHVVESHSFINIVAQFTLGLQGLRGITMKHGAAPAAGKPVDARPRSCVSEATGLIGLAGMIASIAACWTLGIGVVGATALILLGTHGPMILWLVLAERVWARSSTGLDWGAPRPWAQVWRTSATKLAGLGVTLAALGAGYALIPYYSGETFRFFHLALIALGALMPLWALYVVVVDRVMVEPRDELWHFGQFVLGRGGSDAQMLRKHLLGWAIKGFFTAFMFSILPPVVARVSSADLAALLAEPVRLGLFLVTLCFLADAMFAAMGYLLPLRVLDAHLRSPNPHLMAWVAALACYPPFAVMAAGGPLDHRALSGSWTQVFGESGVPAIAWCGLLLSLAVLYAWATVIFGVRFSNLTHRGIITNGPYRYFKHPAYLAKTLYWWLAQLPFLTAATPGQAAQASFLLACVTALYWLRARTEEWHLMEDPAYAAYAAWIARNGLIPRMIAPLRRWRDGAGVLTPPSRPTE